MASHVVVIDTSARRATVKVGPGTYLSDVLGQACGKLGVKDSSLYGLKYNKKNIDLSLTFRLANLPSGAQLELVQASKSPSVVNVALQFPQAENNLRLTEKFPSSTSLWQVLRRFESGKIAGGTPHPLNITQRSIAERNTGAYGAGRMFYEMPTLSLMNREFATFVDLQKTLAAVGVTSGSALLRLNFKHSGKPLEEAMAEISEYFKEAEEPIPSASTSGQAPAPAPTSVEKETQMQETTAMREASQPAKSEAETVQAQPAAMEDVQHTAPTETSEPQHAAEISPISTTTPRITTFLAPDGNVPTASMRHNEEDYVPTIDHAKTHQARLETLGKNQRLLSDAELEIQRKEKEAKVQQVKSVSVRFRMPDQTQIQTSYTREDTAESLFATMNEVLRHPGEAYQLSYRDGGSGKQVTISRFEKKTLIQGLGWTGNTLVYVSWPLEGISEKARTEPALKDEYLKTATRLTVDEPKEEEEEKKGGFLGGILGGGNKDKGKVKGSLSAGEKEAKLGKLLGLGRKK